MTNIFISYSRKDSEFAFALEKRLRGEGFDVWIDKKEIHAGEDWIKKIEEAIESCDIMLVILSPNAIESDIIKSEYRHAQDNKKTVIPILLHDCKIPFLLKIRQYIDFQGDFDHGFNDLLLGIVGYDDDVIISRMQRIKNKIISVYSLFLRNYVFFLFLVLIFIANSFALFSDVLNEFNLSLKAEAFTIFIGDKFRDKKVSNDIKLVTFDSSTEDSENRVQRWREKHTQLIETLSSGENKAKVIVFDVIFTDYKSKADDLLLNAINEAHERGTFVILGYGENECGEASGINKTLQESKAKFGFVDIIESLDHARLAVLIIRKKDNPECDKNIPLYALSTLAYSFFKCGNSVLSIPNVTKEERLEKVESLDHSLNISCHGAKEEGRFRASHKKIASSTVIGGNIEDSDELFELFFDFINIKITEDGKREWGKENSSFTYGEALNKNNSEDFKNKIVLVGEYDYSQNKKDKHPILQSMKKDRYGVELHADAINSLLGHTAVTNNAIVFMRFGGQCILLFALIVLGYYLAMLSGKIKRRIIIFIAVFLYIVLIIHFYVEYLILIHILYHFSALFSSYYLSRYMLRGQSWN